MLDEALAQFAHAASKRPFEIARAHAEGSKLVAYTGSYISDELIHAAGAIPYPSWRGGEPDCADAAIPYTCRFLNPLYRSILGIYLKNIDPVMRMMDVLAVSISDVQIARIAENLELLGVNVSRVGVPSEWETLEDFKYYYSQVCDFKTNLERLTGHNVTDEELRSLIGKTNRINELLREIDDFRKKHYPPISGTQFLKMNHWSVVCEPDVAIARLEQVLKEVTHGTDESNCRTDAKRVILAGHSVAIGDYIVPQALEDVGCLIVGELMDDTYRQFRSDISTEGDPLEVICRFRYLDRYPMNNLQPSWALRQKSILDMARERQADAVVWYDLLYDELHDMEYTLLARLLSRENIPLLRITSSYEFTREAMGPLNTRIETFAELLKG